MKLKKFKLLRASLIASSILLGVGFLPAPAQAQQTTKGTIAQPETIKFACPDMLFLVAQAPEGWEYPWGSKKLKFKSAAVSDGMMICSYSQSLGDALTRPIPKGYQCQNDGGRNFECKKVKPLIKVPGK